MAKRRHLPRGFLETIPQTDYGCITLKRDQGGYQVCRNEGEDMSQLARRVVRHISALVHVDWKPVISVTIMLPDEEDEQLRNELQAKLQELGYELNFVAPYTALIAPHRTTGWDRIKRAFPFRQQECAG